MITILQEKWKEEVLMRNVVVRDVSSYEANFLQKLCFGIPLTSAAIEDVKRVVSDGAPDGIVHDSISLTGN